MYNTLVIAKYIVDKYNHMNSLITNLVLQKVLYFVQAEFLVTKGTPCFEEEIYAWNMGPVVKSVYRKYSIYGGSAIIPVPKESWEDYGIADADRVLIDGIIDQCVAYSKKDLTELVQHQKPWRDAYQSDDKKISKEVLYDYFA